MTLINVPMEEGENRKVEKYNWKWGLKSKIETVKKMIREFKENERKKVG